MKRVNSQKPVPVVDYLRALDNLRQGIFVTPPVTHAPKWALELAGEDE